MTCVQVACKRNEEITVQRKQVRGNLLITTNINCLRVSIALKESFKLLDTLHWLSDNIAITILSYEILYEQQVFQQSKDLLDKSNK